MKITQFYRKFKNSYQFTHLKLKFVYQFDHSYMIQIFILVIKLNHFYKKRLI